MIAFACPGCTKNFQVKDEFAGRTTKCPKCGTVLRIPAPTASSALAAEPPTLPAAPPVPNPLVFRFHCAVCNIAYDVPSADAGRKFNCQNCGQRIQVPAPPQNKTVLGKLPGQQEVGGTLLEDGEDRPRRRRREEEDDEDRSRKSGGADGGEDDNGWEDHDDRRSSRGRKRSGLLTTTGIITIIYGSLMVVCGIGSFYGSAMAGDVPGFLVEQTLPGFAIARANAVLQTILGFVTAGTGIAGGIGVLQRKHWGRILTFVTVGLGLLFLLLELVTMIIALGWTLPAENKAGMIAGLLLRLLLLVCYPVFTLVALMPFKRKREFQ